MPLFLAEHTWEKEKTPAVIKAIIQTFIGLAAGVIPEGWPKTTNLCATYALPGERAICIWEADKAETLENAFKAFKEFLPMETKITPIVQTYPAGPGLYTIIAQIMQ